MCYVFCMGQAIQKRRSKTKTSTLVFWQIFLLDVVQRLISKCHPSEKVQGPAA